MYIFSQCQLLISFNQNSAGYFGAFSHLLRLAFKRNRTPQQEASIEGQPTTLGWAYHSKQMFYLTTCFKLFNSHQYLTVPKSNPSTRRKTSNFGASDKWSSFRFPFTFNVIEYVERVPRLTAASCSGFNFHCKPVMYKHSVLIRRWKNYWMWT